MMVQYVTFGLTGWDAEFLFFCGTPTSTLGLENLGLRTLLLTLGPKPDSDSDSMTYCATH